MKFKYLVPLALLPSLLLVAPAKAENPAQVKQLLETNACMGCDLSNANLTQAHLIGADLRNADLRGANLTEANLEGADMTGANLKGANLTESFLTNASLNEANLASADLTRAKVYYADVAGANVQDLTLTDAEIYGTAIGIGGEADSIPENVMPAPIPVQP
jgi:uncharacterized protein YjbI with pentapeptide repeats